MNREKLEIIQTEFQGTSWALWSDRFPEDGCLEEDVEQLDEFINSHHERLDGRVVLLSLNPSAVEPPGYQNFHSPDSKHYDSRLKRFIQENGLDNITGAFMADIVPEEVTPHSNEVTPENADVEQLLAQLEVLGYGEYDIVCLSRKAFEALQEFFGAEPVSGAHNINTFSGATNGISVAVHRVWHYSNWGANAEKVPKLEQQLKHLNEEIIERGRTET